VGDARYPVTGIVTPRIPRFSLLYLSWLFSTLRSLPRRRSRGGPVDIDPLDYPREWCVFSISSAWTK
jgi:hypothetical protein